ncbi:hypothetical protein ACQR1I_31180 [Bradyrhizobium sp. HKCCYLS2038]|uniref:hypothetical protein n=1 Tax=unclassified Bradyrhizobium TaxID=2631580 RepID=UPI003EB9CFA9
MTDDRAFHQMSPGIVSGPSRSLQAQTLRVHGPFHATDRGLLPLCPTGDSNIDFFVSAGFGCASRASSPKRRKHFSSRIIKALAVTS